MYGLAGPCLAIDTACSSSLVATSAAHNSLMLGQTASALAGGVNLLLSANTHAMYSVAGLAPSLIANPHFPYSPDGRSCLSLNHHALSDLMRKH